MTYHLLIVPRIIADQRYKEFLSFYETVTGLPTTVEFGIKNIGEKSFPGGEILGGCVQFETALGMGTYFQILQVTPSKITSIAPNQAFITRCVWIPWAPGLWRAKMEIKPTTGEKIEYYQKKEGKPMKENEWFQFLYAVDRHQLDLTLLLRQSSNIKR